MENRTIIPVVSDCRPRTYEDEPLWIMGMLVVSVISTLVAIVLRRARVRAPRAREIARAPPPSPRKGEEEEEMV